MLFGKELEPRLRFTLKIMIVEKIIVLAICFMILATQNCFAYLDPGLGSIIVQALIATAIGGLYFIKLYWKKLTTFWKGLFGSKDE